MDRIIADEVARLENISKMMELGNSMFTTCFAFDCFAQAVEHELIYAKSVFMEAIEKIRTSDYGRIFYIDRGEDWLAWKEKFQHYARYSDLYGIISVEKRWDLWSDEHLHSDKKLKKEMSLNEDGFYKVTDYRNKYELGKKLETLAKLMEKLHQETNITNKDIAIAYYNFKKNEYNAINGRRISENLEPLLSHIPSRHKEKNSKEIFWKNEEKLKSIGFLRYLQEDYNVDKYFYDGNTLDEETAGMYLMKYVKELTTEQKEAFYEYVIIREKVMDFLSKNSAMDAQVSKEDNQSKGWFKTRINQKKFNLAKFKEFLKNHFVQNKTYNYEWVAVWLFCQDNNLNYGGEDAQGFANEMNKPEWFPDGGCNALNGMKPYTFLGKRGVEGEIPWDKPLVGRTNATTKGIGKIHTSYDALCNQFILDDYLE